MKKQLSWLMARLAEAEEAERQTKQDFVSARREAEELRTAVKWCKSHHGATSLHPTTEERGET